MSNKREFYQFTPSRKYVRRAVILTNGKVRRTRLFVENNSTVVSDPQSSFERAFLTKSKWNRNDERLPSLRGADLFCGAGGLSLGVRGACFAIGRRFEPILAVDIDFCSLEVYKANFSPRRAYKNDIWDVINGQLGARLTTKERTLVEDLGKIDILLAGPPCQGHSDLNNHTRRIDQRNKLYERVGRFAEITEPKYILVENVPTVIHSHDRALDNTVNLLLKYGYYVDTGTVDLSVLGVPQKRKRHVLIASIKGNVSIEDIVNKHRVHQIRDLKWAIGDLEQEEANTEFTRPSNLSYENRKRIDYLFDHGLHDLPNNMRPPCHRNGHTYKSMYGRMKYNKLAQTITSGYGSPGQGRFIHPTQRRTLTPHEAARLQFFPDFFDFSSVKKRTALASMIGNAVPMRLSYIICLEFFV